MTVAAFPAAPRKRYTVHAPDGRVIGKAELRVVPVASIKRDFAYQRDIDSGWVETHRPYDPHLAGAAVLSSRAGGPYVIDGSHRLSIAETDGIPSINAFVIDGLTQKDEADLFVLYQRERRNLTAHALLKADTTRGDPETLAMLRVVTAAGFRMPTTRKASGPDAIMAIDAIRYIHRYGGDDLLGRTLRLVHGVWLTEEKALSGQVLKGLALFLYSAGTQAAFRGEQLDKVMRAISPMKLLRLSQAVAERRHSVTTSAGNVAEALLESYNKALPKGEQPLGPLTIGRKRRPTPSHQ